MPAQAVEFTEKLWTERELAARYERAEKTLRNWRALGIGPASVRIRGRVFYRDSDVAAWEAAQPNATSAAS